nr:hypothetical protein CFP56_75538 [Quercus suber]
MRLWYLRYTCRLIKCFIALGVVFFLLFLFWRLEFSRRHYDTWTWTACTDSSLFARTCTVPKATIAQDTQIVVKTGASEPQVRLNSQLATVLSEIPSQNVLIFSDMEDQVGSHHIYDAYAGMSVQERAQYPEFALYDAQQEYQRQGRDPKLMGGGWDLAKYMNLAMKREIWKMRRVVGIRQKAWKKWFVFIDTDTFIEWDNLFGLLEHLNAADQVYIGSPVWLPMLQFAHGGSAYVLSYGALEALNKPESHDQNGPLHSQFGLNTTALCCGDEALARVLKTKGVGLKGYWPMFNGETPSTLSFGRDLWCEPVISLHHLDAEDMQDLWHWVEDWKVRTTSMVACEADKLCFQFVYDGTTCALSHYIRLGRQRSPGEHEAQRYTSGWNVGRIRDWTLKTGCASARWSLNKCSEPSTMPRAATSPGSEVGRMSNRGRKSKLLDILHQQVMAFESIPEE